MKLSPAKVFLGSQPIPGVCPKVWQHCDYCTNSLVSHVTFSKSHGLTIISHFLHLLNGFSQFSLYSCVGKS